MEKVKGVELIWATVDATVYGSQSARYVLQYALRNNIPVMGFSENMVEAGALFAAYPDFASMGAQGAGLVVRVLSGEPAGSIPAVSPREVATCVNTRVANAGPAARGVPQAGGKALGGYWTCASCGCYMPGT